MKHVLPILFLAFALASCESDLTTSNTATLEKKLLLSPAHLEGEQFVPYTFKARVTNMPASDVHFFWDFDDGNGFQEFTLYTDDVREHIFYEPKIHSVKVKAQDYFTNKLLGIDSIRADIRPPTKFVEISPEALDTILPMNSNGTTASIRFDVSTSTPQHLVNLFWDFNDDAGVIVDSLGTGRVFHSFPGPGTYAVRVAAYEKNGLYIGADTISVTIRTPTLSKVDFAGIKAVSAFLVVDSAHPFIQDQLFKNPLSLKILCTDTLFASSKFSAGSFITSLSYSNAAPSQFRILHDTIAGAFSSDFKVLRSVRVAVSDTGLLAPQTSPTVAGSYSFFYEFKDLELLAVTTNKLVYRSRSPIVADFTSVASFRAIGLTVRPCGYFSETSADGIRPFEEKQGAYGLVIFDR